MTTHSIAGLPADDADGRRFHRTSHFTAKTAKIAKNIEKVTAILTHRTIVGLLWGISDCVVTMCSPDGV
jgi:hypothetical protein